MNSETETCPSCKNILHSHSNQQISECIKKQLNQFSKQEKEILVRYFGKSVAKGVDQGIGGSTIA